MKLKTIWKAPYTLRFPYKLNRSAADQVSKPIPQLVQKEETNECVISNVLSCRLLKKQSTNRFAFLSDDEGEEWLKCGSLVFLVCFGAIGIVDGPNRSVLSLSSWFRNDPLDRNEKSNSSLLLSRILVLWTKWLLLLLLVLLRLVSSWRWFGCFMAILTLV